MNHTYKVLNPVEFSGSLYGDFGYEIDGVKSENSYVSKNGAYNAMWRKLNKLNDN